MKHFIQGLAQCCKKLLLQGAEQMVCLGPLPPSVDVRIPCRPDWPAVGHGPGRTSVCLKIWAWTVVTISGTKISLLWSLLFLCRSTLSPKRQVAHAVLQNSFSSLHAPNQKGRSTIVRGALASTCPRAISRPTALRISAGESVPPGDLAPVSN